MGQKHEFVYSVAFSCDLLFTLRQVKKPCDNSSISCMHLRFIWIFTLLSDGQCVTDYATRIDKVRKRREDNVFIIEFSIVIFL